MIVGNGLLANAFAPHFSDDLQVAIFASGVSNSGENRLAQFERERQLLQASLGTKKFIVYFSTCSVHDPQLAQSPYVQHKLEMEQLVSRGAQRKAIFRLPQVVGQSANPHTLTNYLYQKISSGARFQIWLNARRNLIDISDVATLVTHLVKKQRTDATVTDIACPFSVSILDLVKIFETVLGREANYEGIAAGAQYAIDTRQTELVAHQVGVVFDERYVDKLIHKYYA